MAQVRLARDWFGPDGKLYRKEGTGRIGQPVSISDRVIFDENGKSRLPSSAVIVTEAVKQPAATKESDLARDHDPVRLQQKLTAERMKKLDATADPEAKPEPAFFEPNPEVKQNEELQAEERARRRQAIKDQLATEKAGKKGKK